MKFKDISFDERGRFANSGPGLLLPGGYWVSKKIVELAWSQVRARFSALDWKVQQTAESLLGETFWKPRKCGQRIALGRCVKYFVDHEMLPLRVANPKKKGKRKYVRNS
jgi:hypothetical protein